MKQLLTVSLLVVFLTSSCMVSKEQVGRYNEIEGNTKVYEINKDAYLFWNLIPLRRTDKKLPIKDYEKISY